MKKFKHKGIIFSFFFFFGLFTGCSPLAFFAAGGAAGAGGYKYYKGSLTVFYRFPYVKVWDASISALRVMELQIKGQEHDISSGKIMAVRADGIEVFVYVKYKSPKSTEVIIRVGAWGEKGASMEIADRIEGALKRGSG